MQTLEEHNKKRRAEIYNKNNPHQNGIECPECGVELWDSDPRMSCMSNPPQKEVHCPSCGYKGFRVA